MNQIIVRILRNRITREKATNKLNVEEITTTLNIFLAGGSITTKEFDEFTAIITPETTPT